MLVQVIGAGCRSCAERAAADDDWETQFTDERFWQVLSVPPPATSTIPSHASTGVR